MRLVIDMQGAQTGSRFRGIGRYTNALVRGMLRNAGKHEIWMVVNGALEESIDAIRANYAALIPPARIRVFECPAPVSDVDRRFATRGAAAELIREHFIAQLRPDAVLVTSLFESYFEQAVVSAGCFTDPRRTAVILYDLIPYLDPAGYLALPLAHTLYMAKIASLRRAGVLLAISNFARAEAIEVLGLDPAGVVPISTAVDESFAPHPTSSTELAALRAQFGITRPMLLCAPGGYDKRKNLPGLISAYALVPPALRDSHQLVIASRLTDEKKAELLAHARRNGLAPDAMILTGYLTDAQLIGLYQSATLFIFPSLHEGFGLPALEAMACGAPVIGSNTTSLPEVIGLPEAMFDPASPPAMAARIAEVLGDPALLARLRAHGKIQAARFSWNATAQRALRAIEQQVARAGPPAPPPSRSDLINALLQLPGVISDSEMVLELAFSLQALPDPDRAPVVLATTDNVQLSQTGGIWHYRYAPSVKYAGMVTDLYPGDTLTGIDLTSPQVRMAAEDGLYAYLHRLGVALHCYAGTGLAGTALAPWQHQLLARAAQVDCASDAVAQLLACAYSTAVVRVLNTQYLPIKKPLTATTGNDTSLPASG